MNTEGPERWRAPDERYEQGISNLVVTLFPDGEASIWVVDSDIELQYAKEVTDCTHWRYLLKPLS